MFDWFILLLTIAVFAMLPFALVAWRVERGKPPGIGGWVGRIGTRWGQWSAKNKRAFAELSASPSLPKPVPRQRPQPPYDPIDVDERLDEQFQLYRAGSLSLEGYRQAVEDEEWRLRDALDELKDAGRRETIDGLARSELRDAIDQCRWRREWIEKESSKATFDASGLPDKLRGDWARFCYVDAQGEVTEREIRNWHLSARYIEGFCMARREGRTFRLDRIDQWIGWG